MPKTVGPVFKPRISRLKRFLCVAKRERGVSGKSREYSQVTRDKIGSGRVLKPSRESAKTAASIYTDWANYYLERAKSKKKVSDLSADCRDGLLLAEVIEAVTTFKVPDLVKKPKTAQHMVSFPFS
ncbi:AGAP009421-PA-like protein [Anopheles sinensis]|uniref:AGAP009421-PA-like protein n=1 Tax=Anopheles sinensis TaxID=74873 RepID=A0A084VPV9_ANOSI|nr:AGAP009421-PA-like protein [Anopheles sinensis]